MRSTTVVVVDLILRTMLAGAGLSVFAITARVDDARHPHQRHSPRFLPRARFCTEPPCVGAPGFPLRAL
eukprot:8160893-Lingulodinium_polyedra.AAC.1